MKNGTNNVQFKKDGSIDLYKDAPKVNSACVHPLWIDEYDYHGFMKAGTVQRCSQCNIIRKIEL